MYLRRKVSYLQRNKRARVCMTLCVYWGAHSEKGALYISQDILFLRWTVSLSLMLSLSSPFVSIRFDTNGSMLRAAFSAAGIALGAAGFVVLFASKSFILTGFAVFTICFVLASATAMLVGIGWTLGFLESICFAILIGISCDFVIHFGHAFAMLEGNYDKHIRTKFALLTMGPSILAAAFTTICSAVVMLFTVISFFRKFAVILCFTVLQATIGSLLIYLTLAETLGPA